MSFSSNSTDPLFVSSSHFSILRNNTNNILVLPFSANDVCWELVAHFFFFFFFLEIDQLCPQALYPVITLEIQKLLRFFGTLYCSCQDQGLCSNREICRTCKTAMSGRGHTLPKFWRYNEVNPATSALSQILAWAIFFNPPTHSYFLFTQIEKTVRFNGRPRTPRGKPCCIVRILEECTDIAGRLDWQGLIHGKSL